MYFSKCKNGDKVCSNNCTISQVERFVESSTTPGECMDSSNIKHSSDCSKYYKCDHGNPAMKLCSPGTLFNHILSVCDWPVNVYKVRPECLEETIYETMANKLLTSTSEGPMLYAPQTENNPYTKNTQFPDIPVKRRYIPNKTTGIKNVPANLIINAPDGCIPYFSRNFPVWKTVE